MFYEIILRATNCFTLRATNKSDSVTATGNPVGTNAVRIAMAFMTIIGVVIKFGCASLIQTPHNMRHVVTVVMANMTMIMTKLFISFWRVVFSSLAPDVSDAMEPMVVLTPVFMTIPLPVPLVIMVAMKAIFFDSV